MAEVIFGNQTLQESYENTPGFFYLEAGGQTFDPNTCSRMALYFNYTDPLIILNSLNSAGGGVLSMYAENDLGTLLGSWNVTANMTLSAFPVNVDRVSNITPAASNITAGANYTFQLSVLIDYPAIGDVRAGVLYGANDSLNGTLAIPPVAKVSSGYGYGNNGTEYTGNLTIPGVAKVKSGTAYGENSAMTGNLTLPGINQTLNGTLYGENSALTGVLRVPAAGDVRSGTGFGANGTQYTGTLDPGNGTTIIRREEVMALNLYPQFDLQAGTGGNLTLPSIPDGALGAFIVPVGGNITWRGDGGNAATAGSLLPDGSGKAIYNLSKFRWCGGNGTMNLTIQWLRSPID